MSKKSTTVTESQRQKALNACRTMYTSYSKSAAYFDANNKPESAAWQRHRLEDLKFIASILNAIETIQDEVTSEDVCPF